MKKKLISALLSVAMVSALLAGCGSKAEPESTPAPADTQAEAGSEAEPSEPAESVAEAPAASGEGKVYYLNFKPEQAED